MGSPLAPILANIFLRHFEEKAFQQFTGTKPLYYRRYVDDSFLIFKEKSDVDMFFHYFNSLHTNINITMEMENFETGCLSFLDVKVTRNGQKFQTQTFYKQTHTGLYTNWYSFAPRRYKINLVKCLLSRTWNICSNCLMMTAKF